jgi:Holliday junction DNA helicase RuvB
MEILDGCLWYKGHGELPPGWESGEVREDWGESEDTVKPGDLETLKQIAECEDSREWSIGWSWRDARVWPATLNRLCLDGFLDTVFRSNSYTGYRLTEKARAVLAGGAPQEPHQTHQDAIVTLPDGLFQDIIGHDDVKDLLRAALLAERPVHVLLAGPPALAKTLFLWDIERAWGEAALWLVGSATSRAGLWDLIAEREPRLLLIDELDKMGAADTAALLSLMEGGRIVRAKVGRKLDRTIPLRVVAATNAARKLSPELLSRFALRRLYPYGQEEYRAVVKGVLVRREGAAPEAAEEIALRLDGRSQDVRDAIRVCRLAPQVGVERAVELLAG